METYNKAEDDFGWIENLEVPMQIWGMKAKGVLERKVQKVSSWVMNGIQLNRI